MTEAVFGEGKWLIYDVRNEKDFKNSHIINAKNINKFKKIWELKGETDVLNITKQLDNIFQDKQFSKRGTKYKICLLYGQFDVVEILRNLLEIENKFEKVYFFNKFDSFFEDNLGLIQFEPKKSEEKTIQVFKGNFDTNTKRKNLKVENSRAFLLENFFSETECKFYIDQLENIGFKKVQNEYPQNYRNNERLILFSNELSGVITEKLFPFLNQKDIDQISPIGFGSEGIWKPYRINECFKFCKYEKGQKFDAHRDGIYSPNEDECTIFTVLIYLNHNFKGGKTLFLDSKKNIKFSGIPKCGSAVVFTGETIHQAEPIIEGFKYILRTEIIFKRVNSHQIPINIKEKFLEDPKYFKMKELFNKSESYENSGDVEKYTKIFVEGLELLVENKLSTTNQFEDQLLPGDLLSTIFCFLEKKDVVKVMMVSKSWNYYCSNNEEIWKRFYLEMYQKLPLIDSISTHWYSICKQRYSIENNFRSLVVFLDDRYANFSINEEKKIKIPYPEDGTYFGIYNPDSDFNVYNLKRNFKVEPIVRHVDSVYSKVLEWGCLWFRSRNIDKYEVGHRCTRQNFIEYTKPIYFVNDGNVTDLNGLEQAFVAFYYDLNMDPSCHPVTLIEPPKKWSIEEKSKISKMLLNHFNVSGVCFVNSIDLLFRYHGKLSGTLVFLHKGVKSIITMENKKVIEFVELPNEQQTNGVLRKNDILSIDEISNYLNSLNELKSPIIVSLAFDDEYTDDFIGSLKLKFSNILYEKDDLIKAGISFSNGPNFPSLCQYNSVHDCKKIQFETYQLKVNSVIAKEGYNGSRFRYLNYDKGDTVYYYEDENEGLIGSVNGETGRIHYKI
eukprot:gene12143-5634_t